MLKKGFPGLDNVNRLQAVPAVTNSYAPGKSLYRLQAVPTVAHSCAPEKSL